MLRILFWKIGFEWVQLKRLLAPDIDRKILYFAFGANLAREVIEKRGIGIYDEFDYSLQSAKLRFSQSGFYAGHGYASADPSPNSEVYGKMYLILESDARRMDYFEGVPFLKVHHKVFKQADGLTFYYYRAKKPLEDLKPTQKYLNYLVNSYRKMSIVPKQYTDSLAKTAVLAECLPQNQTGDFIRDIRRWPKSMHSMLIRYEGYCLLTVKFLWNRSLFQSLIRKRTHNLVR